MALAGSFSVVYQLPEPKLAVLESVGGLHCNSNGHGKSGVVSPDLTKSTTTASTSNESLEGMVCRILSVVYQLPEPKLQYLKASVACTVTRTAMVEEWCSFALTKATQRPPQHHNERS
jgi:hypothetical protein